MGKYDGLSEQERRKLYKDLSRAADDIRAGERRRPASRGPTGEPGLDRGEQAGQGRGWHRRFRRPRWGVRLRIESYCYAEGFLSSGLRQYLGSFLAFLWPRRDPVNPRLLRELFMDNPYRGDPTGYGLEKCLWELERQADGLLKGSSIFKRDADRRSSLRGELTRDFLNWAPAGYRLLRDLQPLARRAAEPLDHVRARFHAQREVDAFDLAATARAVFRLAYLTDAPLPVIREHLGVIGELSKGLFKRVAAQEEAVRRGCARVDQQVREFVALFERLRAFARELYPVMLKLLDTFRRHEDIGLVLPQIYEFIALREEERIAMVPLAGTVAEGPLAPGTPLPAGTAGAAEGPEPGEAPEADVQEGEAAGDGGDAGAVEGAVPASPEEEEAGPAPAEEEPAAAQEEARDLQLAYRGILTILEHTFPGSRLEQIPEGDFSSLFWFHTRVFARREVRSPLISRRQDFTDLLWKVSRNDPLAPVFVLYEIVRHMLESINADAIGQLEDPLRGQGGQTPPGKTQERFAILRSQWNVVREELFVRYLREVDYYEREATLRDREPAGRFHNTPAGRRSVETVNQVRNHVIRGYGHIATLMDRRDVFRCPPLYNLAQELYRLFESIVPDRRQLGEGNPIAARRLGRDDLVIPRTGLILSQIDSYIRAYPEDKRLLSDPVAERNRLFLEILLGILDLLRTLLNAEGGPLRRLGGEVVYADREDRALREEIAADRTPLRVELRRDFEEIDQLTGLISKSEYLRFAPGLFREIQQAGDDLTLLVMDMDHFKAVNDTLGHAVGDEMLRAASQAMLSTGREGDPAVRFGGDELVVVVKGDCVAGFRRAERIRKHFGEIVQGALAEKLQRIPALMAQKELVDKKRQDPLHRGGLEELAGRWKRLAVGTLSIGVAQGLGSRLQHPSSELGEAFRRADAMLYLAKEGGGNRTVIMVDEIEIPLTGEEFQEFAEFSAGKGKPLSTLEGYVDYRRAVGRPPTFGGYSYDGYLNPD